MKKVLAVVLSLILAFSVVAVPASALDASALANINIENVFNTLVDKVVMFLLTYLNKYWPGFEDQWSDAENYVTENFYAGEEAFDTDVAEDAQWSLGYAGASLLDNIDPMSGDYYLAGSLEVFAGRVPTEVLDDQRVRVFALSDGDATVVQAVIDGFGLPRGDVLEIRSRLEEFAEKNGITSINVSVLHQHSAIDTLGMNVPLAKALIINTGNAASGGWLDSLMVTKNAEFMENLYKETVLCIKDAVMGMEEGSLYYGSADIGEYIHDKREPISYDPNMNRLRFVPDDEESAETWILEAGIHCTMMGAGPDQLTADFPYYIEKAINEEVGANVVYVQGAELAITTDGTLTSSDDQTRYEDMVAYGYAVAEKVMAIDNDVALDPVLNIKLAEVALDVDNQIHVLAGRENILNQVIVRNGDGYQMITEIGYMELGNNVGIFLCPGEFDPAIIYGGPESGAAAWYGETWDYAPLADLVDCDNIMVFGLCNDQAGYVLKDNEYHSMFTENEEINAISRNIGSTLTEAYMELIDSTAA